MSQNMYPEEQEMNNLKLEIGLLKKDNEQLVNITNKLSDSIEKIQEMNGNLLRMISLHEQKHEGHLKEEAELKEDVKDLHSRITTVTRELHDKIGDVEKHLAEKIDSLRKELNGHREEDKSKNNPVKILAQIENYKYLVLGIVLAAGFILGNFNTGLFSLLFK
jgi:chromosome segregation ATPase